MHTLLIKYVPYGINKHVMFAWVSKSVSSVDIFKNDYDIWFPISKPRMKAFQFHSIIGFSQCVIKPTIEYLHFVIYDPANDLTINYAIN